MRLASQPTVNASLVNLPNDCTALCVDQVHGGQPVARLIAAVEDHEHWRPTPRQCCLGLGHLADRGVAVDQPGLTPRPVVQ